MLKKFNRIVHWNKLLIAKRGHWKKKRKKKKEFVVKSCARFPALVQSTNFYTKASLFRQSVRENGRSLVRPRRTPSRPIATIVRICVRAYSVTRLFSKFTKRLNQSSSDNAGDALPIKISRTASSNWQIFVNSDFQRDASNGRQNGLCLPAKNYSSPQKDYAELPVNVGN